MKAIPAPLSIQWLESISKKYSPLEWLLQSRRIHVGKSLGLNEEERVSFGFAMLTLRAGTNLLVEHWCPTTRLASTMTAGLLVADFVERVGSRERLLRGDILFITRRIGAGVASLRAISVEKVDLADIWEVSSASNAAKLIGSSRPRLFVSPPKSRELFSKRIALGAVVIDASHPLTLERLGTILQDPCIAEAKLKIVVVPEGFHFDLPSQEANWLRWVWDRTSVSEARAYRCNDRQHQPDGAHWRRSILVCDDPDLDKALSRARSKLTLLSKYASSPSLELLKAWGVYHRLSSLAIPLGDYEEAAHRHYYARPLSWTLEQLASSRPETTTSVPGTEAVVASEWRVMIEALGDAYERLKGDEPSKFWGVALAMEEYVSSGFARGLVLLVPTQIEANILIRHLKNLYEELPNHLHPQALVISTPRGFVSSTCEAPTPFDVMLLSPLTQRWQFLDARLLEATTLTYPHEVPLVKQSLGRTVSVVLHGASLEAKQQTLRAFESQLGFATACTGKINTHAAVDADKRIILETKNVEGAPHRRSQETIHEVELAPNWAWDAASLTHVPPLYFSAGVGTRGSDLLANVDLVRIRLLGGQELVIPAEQRFDVYRYVTEEVVERMARQVHTGDVLILIDDAEYATLFDRIVEALEAHPKFALMSVWLQLWDLTKESALEQCDNSYSELQRRLKEKGVALTQQAVRSWFTGTMGPQATKAVYALIELSQNRAAIANRRNIRAALGCVRGMRRSVGRRVKAALRYTSVEPLVAEGLADEVDMAIEDVIAVAKHVQVEAVELIPSTSKA